MEIRYQAVRYSFLVLKLGIILARMKPSFALTPQTAADASVVYYFYTSLHCLRAAWKSREMKLLTSVRCYKLHHVFVRYCRCYWWFCNAHLPVNEFCVVRGIKFHFWNNEFSNSRSYSFPSFQDATHSYMYLSNFLTVIS